MKNWIGEIIFDHRESCYKRDFDTEAEAFAYCKAVDDMLGLIQENASEEYAAAIPEYYSAGMRQTTNRDRFELEDQK